MATITDLKERRDAIPAEIETARFAIGAAALDGDDKAVTAGEKKVAMLETELKRIDQALEENERREIAAREAADLSEAERHAAEMASALDASKQAAGKVDAALDVLFKTLRDLHEATDAAINVGLARKYDVRDLQVSVWGSAIHERLMQEGGPFSAWLKGVPNNPSRWSSPVAGHVPTMETVTPKTRRAA